MKVHEGKNCKLHIKEGDEGQDIFFTAKILDVDDANSLITFKDKYGDNYTFAFKNIVRIREE